MHVMTRRIGETVDLANGSVVRVVSLSPVSATVQVDDDEVVTLRWSYSGPVPGGKVHLLDLLPPDRVRLGFTPADIVAWPEGLSREGHPGRVVRPGRFTRRFSTGALVLAGTSLVWQLADPGCSFPDSAGDVALHVGTAVLAVVALVAGLLAISRSDGTERSGGEWVLPICGLVVLAMSAMSGFSALWGVGCF